MPDAQSPKTKRPLIAIYCGAQLGNNPIYAEKSQELIKNLCSHHFGIVYGGASIGLMGLVANTALQYETEVLGVIPKFMLDYEIAHANLTELQIVDSMHQRKAIMAERASAFIALPGGFGTLEEILEIATWAQLSQHQKIMILYNINGFYDSLIQHLRHAVAEGFLPEKHFDNLLICNNIQDILKILKEVN